jgi:23S rRNA pseudouridine1911/1915/1917 synthase
MDGKFKINIIYEDNHVLVVEKPPNLLTQSDSTGDGDMLTMLREDLKLRHNKPGNVFLGLVHRLDRPVGGVMVFAKTSKAASRLSEQIRLGEFGKSYMAVMHGAAVQSSGTLVDYLIKDETTNTVRITSNAAEGKKASLYYEVMDSKEGLSLVHVKLHTGRSHQIRVQFAAMGHPLYGDQKYGAALNKPGMQLALWSVEVGFTHPTLKKYEAFTTTPPKAYPWNIFQLATDKMFVEKEN